MRPLPPFLCRIARAQPPHRVSAAPESRVLLVPRLCPDVCELLPSSRHLSTWSGRSCLRRTMQLGSCERAPPISVLLQPPNESRNRRRRKDRWPVPRRAGVPRSVRRNEHWHVLSRHFRFQACLLQTLARPRIPVPICQRASPECRSAVSLRSKDLRIPDAVSDGAEVARDRRGLCV